MTNRRLSLIEKAHANGWADVSVVISDSVLALGAACASWRSMSSANGTVASASFALLAACAILGALYHACRLRWSPKAIQILWSCIVACTSLFAMLFTLAVWQRSGGVAPLPLIVGGVILALGFGCWGGLSDSFVPASIISVVCVLVMLYAIAVPLNNGLSWARYAAVGLAASLLAFAIQLSHWRSGKEWNHNDAYHAVQLLALYPMVLTFE